MLLIAHRGNLSGPNKSENHPDYVIGAIDIYGVMVEVDVWNNNGNWYLGHDKPTYYVVEDFIKNYGDKIYWHAKNLDAFYTLLKMGQKVFFHDHDDFTLTSDKKIWTYPNKQVTGDSIVVCQTEEEVLKYSSSMAYGICTDYIAFAETLICP